MNPNKNDKLFILSFTKVEPLVKHIRAIYILCNVYSCNIYLYREKYLYFCKKTKQKLRSINKKVINVMGCCVYCKERLS